MAIDVLKFMGKTLVQWDPHMDVLGLLCYSDDRKQKCLAAPSLVSLYTESKLRKLSLLPPLELTFRTVLERSMYILKVIP